MDDHGCRDAPLAVIGMACRLPGAEGLDEYWELIVRAGCALGPLPPSRFDESLYFDPRKGVTGKSYSRLGGVVDTPPFDLSRYPVSEDFLAGCDPVHLAFLEVAGEALRHAGLQPLNLPLRNAGVYVGNARASLRSANIVCAAHAHELADFLAQTAGCSRLAPSTAAAIEQSFAGGLLEHYRDPSQDRVILEANRVAGLVAEVFGLTGPAMAVDAACASSLVGLAQAARALQRGRIEMAIVGGASYSAWTSLVLFSQAQALSASGSYPFDARADGFVSSDGYAAIVVKTLERALADGDRVWGVIRGLGVSSDGRGKSLWAPRREGQVLAIRRALAAGVDAAHIGYVEAHGTSTQLGDATEVAALTEALGPLLSRSQRVPIASVKANIGHTRETAGLAGLIKTLLAMHHGQIPPAAGFEQPNPEIPWETIPFGVPTSVSDWGPSASGGVRRAAVDAFGIGGLNVHVLVDDEPERRPGSVHALVPDNVGRSERPAEPPGADDIAVIGRGAIFPGARTLTAFLDLVQGDGDALSAVPADRWNYKLFPQLSAACGNGACPPRGGFVTGFEYDWRKHRVPPRQVAHADPLQFMVLDAAEQALQEAGCLDGGLDLDSTAVVIGAGFGGDFSIELALALRVPEYQQLVRDCLTDHGVPPGEIERVCAEFADLVRARYSALEDETASYSASTLASRVAKTLDLKGGAFALDAGGGSSLAALAAAVDLLESGACSAVLCAGAQRALDPSVFASYRVRGDVCNASESSAAGAAHGFVPGEGCGVVLLKRRTDAERDGNVIQGVIRGIGVATSSGNRREACATAAARALSAACARPAAVEVLEPTGVALKDVDADEQAGLTEAYGEGNASKLERLDAIARRIGYSNGASGMASFLKLLAVLPDRRPAPALAVCDAAGAQAVNGAAQHDEGGCAVRSEIGDRRRVGAVNSLTPSGQAYHVIVESGAAAVRDSPSAGSGAGLRLLRFEAASPDDLVASLREWRASGDAAMPSLAAFSPRGAARLAIVARDDDAVGQQVAQAVQGLAQPAAGPVLERRGIFWGTTSAARPRIAFAFAGQGSQYAGMLRSLVDESSEAAEVLRNLNCTLSKLGLPTFEELAWTAADRLGRELFETQLAVLLADLLLFRVLAASGIVPDVITAHSYGEYAALVASGAWELTQAIEVTRVRCQAIASCEVRGGMFATTAPAGRVELLLRDFASADGVFLANHNAPGQAILAGREPALSEFVRRLQADGHETRPLPVPGPFHTPLMAPVQPLLRTAVAACILRPPTVPFLSSVTNRFTADPHELRDNLVEQLVRPVRYVDLVRRLTEEGIDVIVEVGPRDVLTKLHRQILGDAPVGLIATDGTQDGGVEQLLRVQALLECRGAQIAATPCGGAALVESGPALPTRPVREPGPILHFDATAGRRERNRRAGERTDRNDGDQTTVSRNGQAATDRVDDELAGFLIRFVCEHTGYPPEVVDLDAELEADLGIDSIKKAQLLGELREHFPLRPTGRLTLDAFPTLRHILEFIRESQAAAPAGDAADQRTRSGDATVAALIMEHGAATGFAAGPASPVVIRGALAGGEHAEALAVLNVRTFRGTPYDLGARHGRLEEQAIRRTLQKYVELLGERLFEMRPLQAALDHRDVYFGSDGLAELQGIADAIGMPVEHVAAFNYGLSMEFLPGCTQFAVAARWNGSAGLIHAVNEDWMLALTLPGVLKRMAQVRFPAGGTPFLTLSTCGELAGQNGINARGLAVTSTLLLDRLRRDESTPGRVHPALVKEILERADSIEAALDIVRELPRCGAWSMCLSHWGSDRLCYVEYDAASVEVHWSEEFVESTNHCLLQPALGETPAQSCQRLERLHELLHGERAGDARVTVLQAQSILRDRYDRSLGRVTTHPTKATIRRPYTQASLVMRPATGDAWLTADSVPGEQADRFHHLSLAELFGSDSDMGRQPVAATSPASVASDDPAQCRAVPDRIMNRFVLRMVDAPVPDASAEKGGIAGRVLLLGENPTAAAVRRQLADAGADVLTLPVIDAEAALQELERVWEGGPVPLLLLLTARDADAGCGVAEEPWRERRQRGVLLPYRVCQRWVQLVTRGRLPVRASLIAVTGMEGDFGLSGRGASVEGGALTGLLKAIRHEFDQISTKIIDAPPADPPALVARCLMQELECGAPDVEVAYVCGRRRVLQPVPRPLVARDHTSRPRGTWIVTGGGRGVTAIVAREMGKRYGLKLHLLGSSPTPELPDAWHPHWTADRQELRREITRQAREAEVDPAARWRDVERRLELAATLQEFAAAGVAATYHCCDVTDRGQLTRVLETIRAADGPIRGILHGAGVEAACRFDRKSLAAVEQTLAVKVDAAISLAELTRSDPVEFFVGFGSVSGRFGGHGQTDYSLASDLLAKVLGRLRRDRPDCRAAAIHWPAWDGAGMAMRPESKLALELAGQRFMPPLEGAAHLFDELEAGVPEREVVLYDWPAARGARRSPWTPAEAQAYWRRGPAASAAALIDGIVRLDERHVVAELAFDPQRDPFLVHHRIEDVPILPLVVALEAFAETAQLLRPDGIRAFRDVRIHEGLRFPPGASDRVRVEVCLAGGEAVCELRSDFRNRRGAVTDPSRLHVSAVIDDEAAWSSPATVPVPESARWVAMEYDSTDDSAIKRVVSHGPPLRCLQQFCIAGDRLWGRVRAASLTGLCPSPQKPDWLLPSAALDACLLACSVLAYVQRKPFQLPNGIERLRFQSPAAVGEECLVSVCCRETNSERATYDLALCGADGRIILDAQGYQAAFLKGSQPARC